MSPKKKPVRPTPDLIDPTHVGSVRILGIEFQVFSCDFSEKSLHGESDFTHRQIVVGYNQPLEAVVSTFWHEVFHMVLAVGGGTNLLDDPKLEEALVVLLESGLVPLMQDATVVLSKQHRKKERRSSSLPRGKGEEDAKGITNLILTQLLKQVNARG